MTRRGNSSGVLLNNLRDEFFDALAAACPAAINNSRTALLIDADPDAWYRATPDQLGEAWEDYQRAIHDPETEVTEPLAPVTA